MNERLKVLFLCTENSCRSQMAEGWSRKLKKDTIEAYSAGVEIRGLNSDAVKVMAEAGIDISGHKSKHIDDFKDIELDAVVIVCSRASETCPYFPPRCKVVYAGFDDPPIMAEELARQGASMEEQMDCYRKARDEIRTFVEALPDSLEL
ncbi:arsenate reductase ArsC [Desulfobacula sp.]|uniref:arsenate reductase ArsC n=1 Tax=Desulfobacula sp. TaxID=2593537 RepID=UPI002624503C|nr:arsenate reductase ArsC [Desulfobacula sp.]